MCVMDFAFDFIPHEVNNSIIKDNKNQNHSIIQNSKEYSQGSNSQQQNSYNIKEHINKVVPQAKIEPIHENQSYAR